MMIIDRLTNASLYYPLNDRLAKALCYLQETDFSAIRPGNYEIDGKQVYAIVQESSTKPETQGIWEGHRKYIDIHYLIEGAERIGYANIDHMKAGKYDEEKDFIPFEGNGIFVTALPGTFVIMTPQDAHMPGIAVKDPGPIKKVVMKVADFL